jgi:nickel-dependent lactate racemase
MEKIMGRSDTPVRQVLNYASREFAADLPIVYVQTVVSPDTDRNLKIRGIFIGDDEECFEKASELSLKVNFEMVDKPLDKVVVYLDPEEFKSTWLGNKSIYRSRMALADRGELLVLGPGVKQFGEDKAIDGLIRKYGYRTSPEILEFVENNADLMDNLSAAAHLIHGSSENRFKITYCPGHLSREEIESVGFRYGELDKMMQKYNPQALKDGYNTMPDGEEVFFISNPALGLWAYEGRFKD